MIHAYSPILVLASLAISILACWTALELSCRVHAQRTGITRAFWLGSGALVMGLGIWAMHYVGMLALRTTMPVLYHWPTVLLSFVAAVLASGLALFLVSRPTLSLFRMIAGGIFMGGGIASMHYIGMAAMRMPCSFTYSRPLVALSLLLAVAISMVALHLCFSNRQVTRPWSIRKVGSAVLMGVAVPSMHYVGMAAFQMGSMQSGTMVPLATASLHISELGATAIVGTVTLCIAFALLLASFNRNAIAAESRIKQAESEREQIHGHQQRLIKAYRQNGVGAWEWDPVTDSFSADTSVRSIFGKAFRDGSNVPRARMLQAVHADDREQLQERWSAALAKGDHYENEYRIVLEDGTIRRCRSVATISRHADGTPSGMLGMSWDVTAERKQQEDHAEQARRFYLTLEAIGDAVISVDAEHTIRYANPVACQLMGWAKEECIGRPFAEVFIAQDEATGQLRRSAVERCIEQGGMLLSEDGILLSRNGARYNIQKHVNMVDEQGSAVVTFRDITAARQLKRELEIAATHDSLTGLPNRAAFEATLYHVWTNERQPGRAHCLALLDIDRFKLVNDTAGHLAGDALLRSVSRVLESRRGTRNCFARMGGDEFLLLLPDTTPERAQAICEEILQALQAFDFFWHERAYSVTASIGMVHFGQESPSVEVLTSQADVALFTSKRNGRNRISTYDSAIGEAAGNLLEMEAVNELKSALHQGRFELHAQPIVGLRSSEAQPYFELLVRMRDSNGRLVPPSEFIPAAERYCMMPKLDRWIIQNALESHSSSGAASHVRFAINLSADSLSDPTLWDFVQLQFRQTGVAPASITFEVTESSLIRNLDIAQTFLKRAKDAGCHIALDDFGTGMSSLSYLKQFPLDVIKIDGAFIRNIRLTPLDQSIVQAVSQIAHSMQAEVVAECVEDMATVDVLAALGIDYVQGWATGRPEPLTQVLQRMATEQKIAAGHRTAAFTFSGVPTFEFAG